MENSLVQQREWEGIIRAFCVRRKRVECKRRMFEMEAVTWSVCLCSSLGPIPFIVVGEIFRQEPRAAAMSLSLAFNWICNFILMLIFPFMKVS